MVSWEHFFKQVKASTVHEYRSLWRDLKFNLSWISNRALTSEVLTIAVTKKCNLSCTYCWDTGVREKLPEMSLEEIKKIMVSARKMGVETFNPFGGEPFIRKDMFEILKYGFDLGFKVTLTTNGTLIPDEKIRELVSLVPRSSRFTAMISLDGATSTENDYIRDAGSFAKTVFVIHSLNEEVLRQKHGGIGIILNNVVSRNNFRSMVKFVKLGMKLRVHSVHFLTPTIALDSVLHQSEMVRRNLVILPEEFEELDAMIDEVISMKKNGHPGILNHVDSLEHFKGFYRRQYEQHLPYIEKFRNDPESFTQKDKVPNPA